MSPHEKAGKWSIVAAERHLSLGMLGKALFKRDASHSFLRVKDGNGKVVLELHGLAFNPKTLEASPFKLDAQSLFHTAFYSIGKVLKNAPTFLHVVSMTNSDVMRIVAKGKESAEIPIAEGSEEDMLRCIECALRAAIRINESDLGYCLFGFKEKGRNCHSALAEIVERMFAVHLKMSDMSFATPGIETDLEPLIAGLDDIKPDYHAPMSHIRQSIKEKLALLEQNAEPVMDWVDAGEPAWQKRFCVLRFVADQITKILPAKQPHWKLLLGRPSAPVLAA